MSLPYPSGPPPQPVFPQHWSESPSGPVPDSANLPPVPPSLQRSLGARGSAVGEETDNPWSDLPTKEFKLDQPLPDSLRPGQPQPPRDGGVGSDGASRPHIPNASWAEHSKEDTPRSSLESDRSKDFWDDSDDGQDQERNSPKKGVTALPEGNLHEDPWAKAGNPEDALPVIKRKPVGSGLTPVHSRPEPPFNPGFASNNPFRRPSEQAPENEGLQASGWGQSNKGRQADRGNELTPTGYFQGLTFGESTAPDLSLYNPQPAPQSPMEAWGMDHRSPRPPMPQVPPPPPPGPSGEGLSSSSRQAPLIPVSPRHEPVESPWGSNAGFTAPTPSPIPFPPSQKQMSTYNDELLDRGQNNGVVSLQEELETLPNAANAKAAVDEEPSLLEDDECRPPLPVRPAQRAAPEYFEPPEGPPPQKPPRPVLQASMPSAEEVARMTERRNETYQIKHFNWFDYSSRKLRRSSMLTQNKNGPCPLLALVNALILGATDESQAALDEALRTREQVSLGLIIETLMDEMLSRGFDTVGELMPDVDDLNQFLMRLRTGMNANPRFVPQSSPPPNLMDADDSMINSPQHQRASPSLGTFESTADMKLYGAFQVPLIHGWLPESGSDAAKAFARSAPTYEDAQALQFGEEELEYTLTHRGLSESEQNMFQDITSIKNFLKSYPTQLTPTGLETVQDSIASGSFAIMFRNDHFSTIYKHPESGQLFTLITDAGYAERDEIIWESLVDISGNQNEFFSGDFMPVSHHDAVDESSTHPASRRTSQLLSVNNPTPPTSPGPMSPQEQQEQHDADFAMALQLQEEEEQRQRAERNRRRSGGGPAASNNQPRRPQSGNIPIPLRSTQQPEVRPTIPPRTSHAPPAVTRPSDATAEDAPPAYEEAAKTRPYVPPLGSPLHPSSEPSPVSSNTQLTGTASNVSTHSATGIIDSPHHPPGPNAGMGRREPRRRLSAYNETSQYYNPSQRLHPLSAMAAGPSIRPSGGRRDDRDCTVM